MGARDRSCHTTAMLLLGVALAACRGVYQPLLVRPDAGLPPDAYARCLGLMHARFGRLLVADDATFRLQSDWVPGPKPDTASQQRATIYREGDSLACIVEVRHLGIGLFDTIPKWSAARPDVRLEEDLGDAVMRALSDG